MRPINAHIRGYGRLVNTSVNLDSKVIAIVGPNEAGKTTLLKALAHVDSDQPVPGAQRSRAAGVDGDTTIVTIKYVLDDADRAAVAESNLDQEPATMTVSRSAEGGNIVVGITPPPRKARATLTRAAQQLRKALVTKSLSSWIDPGTVYADPNSDDARDFRAELEAVATKVDGILESTGKEEPGIAEEARSLRSALLEGPKSAGVHDALESVVAWAELKEPGPTVRRTLWNRTPDFLLFAEADRTLESSYELDDELVANTPAGLRNLAGMAKLDLRELLAHVQTEDVARRETALTQANRRLDERFASAWKQSRLSIRLSIDGSLLRINMWEDGDNITVFDERSAGLRMFVALLAFLTVRGTGVPPVLLIDEAENHLHIDAQADLVNMFVRQDQAMKVVYTTHSPACLPPDLGSGIRSVVPRMDNHQVSDIKNNFWHNTAGYAPLMLAMGAAAAAFTPARCVVLAEGATEMILLPTLLRSATSSESLAYQVAPGLSEVPIGFYPKLDLEGAKVAYLLDGDRGGDDLEAALTKAGVPRDLIVRLDVSGIENLIDPVLYSEGIASLLAECNPGVSIPALPTLVDRKDGSWAKQLDAWIVAQGLRGPSKVALANWLVENKKATPSSAGAKELRALHRKLTKAVGGA